MAPKKGSSTTSSLRATKKQITRTPTIYPLYHPLNQGAHFSHRTIVPTRYIVKSTLEELKIHDEVKMLLDNLNLFYFAYKTYPTYPFLVIEFLATYTLKYSKINDAPYIT